MALKSPKNKGYRNEQKIVKLFQSIGIPCRRQPLSGAIADFPHDVYIAYWGGLIGEVKARKRFASITNWKGKAYLLFLIPDFAEPYVLMDWNLFRQFMENINVETEES